MAFSRYSALALSVLAFSVLAAPSTQEVADVNYWASRTTDPEYPLVLNERAVAKKPAFVDIGSPTVYGDSLSSVPLVYSFKYDYFARYADGSTGSSDGFLGIPETLTASMIVGRAADLIGTGYEEASCAALLDAGYSSQCQFPPLIPGENPAGSCTVIPLNGSPYGTLEDDLDSCLGRIADDAEIEFQNLGVPTYPGARIFRAYCTSASRLQLDYKFSSGSGDDVPYGYFQFADNDCRIPALTGAAADQEEPEFDFEDMPDDEVTDEQLAKILWDGGAVTENFLFNHQTGEYTYFSSIGRTAQSVSEMKYQGQYVAGTTDRPNTIPSDIPVDEEVRYSWSGISRGGVSPSPTPNPTATPSPTPGDGEEGQGDLCETSPGVIACLSEGEFFGAYEAWLDDYLSSMVPDGWSEETAFDVPSEEADGSVVTVGLAEVSGCPAPRTIAVWGSVYEVDGDQMLCSALDDVSNLVRLCCSIFAAFILLGARSGGGA